MQQKWLWAAMVSAGVLSACGGGGGGGGGSATPVDTSVSASVSGVAAKGLMANAIVTAHAVNADGTVATAELDRTTTDANGRYTLTFKATQGQPYVIKVKAQANTTHKDEVTGEDQPLPENFTMRSVFVPTSTGTVSTSVSVTPFSEMAVAAAVNTNGGLSSANVVKARGIVADVLGFDPTTVEVKPAQDATSPNEQVMAMMLAAVSQMSKDGALGCEGTGGTKTRCVVQKLSESVSTSTMEFKVGNTSVSSVLSAAATTALANPNANPGGKVPDVVLANVQRRLACAETDGCTPTVPGTPLPGDTTGPAITAAKSLFNNLRSDWKELFGVGSATSATGAFQAQGSDFEQAMKDVQAPVEMVVKDTTVFVTAIDLYNRFIADPVTTSPIRGLAPGEFSTNVDQYLGYVPAHNAVNCVVSQDPAGNQPAVSRETARYVSCRASYYLDATISAGQTLAVTEWAHGFTLTPSATEAGKFTYSSRARYRPLGGNSSSTTVGNGTHAGTVSVSTDANGNVVDFKVSGELPGAFKSGSTQLASASHTWEVSGTRAFTGANASTATVQGTLTAKNADGSTQSTLQIKSGSVTEVPVFRDAQGGIVAPNSPAAVAAAGSGVGAAELSVVWTTPSAEFEGNVSAGNAVWDKSMTQLLPTKAEIAGALRTVANGTKTEFFAGKLTLAAAGMAQFDATQKHSASNNLTVSVNLQGKATAPSRPQLELGVASSMRSDLKEPALVTVSYRSLVNGTPKMSVNATAQRNAAGLGVFTLNEAASKLSMTVIEGASSADLLLDGNTVIGRLQRSGVLTYVDGSFESVDMGL